MLISSQTEPRIIQTQKDIGLLNRAIREQWPTSMEMKERAIQELNDLIECGDAETRLKAIEQLRKIDKHNFDMAKQSVPALHLHQHNHETEELTVEERREQVARRIERLRKYGGDA